MVNVRTDLIKDLSFIWGCRFGSFRSLPSRSFRSLWGSSKIHEKFCAPSIENELTNLFATKEPFV